MNYFEFPIDAVYNADFSDNILGGGEGYAVVLLNSLIEKGIQYKASDIHINPKPEDVEIRFRIDGMLRLVSRIGKERVASVISRLKVMADMNMTENRLPQDGRCMFEFGPKKFDLRVATIPTLFGEKAVIRILDKSELGYEIHTLGMSPGVMDTVKRASGASSGMILISGPTGSGKTTTLYSLLKTMDPEYKNILTIEDPVEYIVENASQIQVNKNVGLDFAAGLRSIVRHDPDIIMVGEIRDFETAKIAVRAAMTGHLVLSSIHTNDSASAVARIIEMGVHPYMVSCALRCVVAQRLVRKICPHCKYEYTPSDEELVFGGMGKIKNPVLFKGRGCEKCLNTGYLGRTGVYEAFPVDERMKGCINKNASDGQIRNEAKQMGMKTILENSADLVMSGITTLDEISVLIRDVD